MASGMGIPGHGRRVHDAILEYARMGSGGRAGHRFCNMPFDTEASVSDSPEFLTKM